MTTANGTGMVVHGAPGLAKAERVDVSVRFTAEQKRVILDTCCGGASADEAAALIAIAEARGLNPILGECYFVKRYDAQARRDRWAVQAAIDSFRIKAEQTGLYAGQDEPEYEYDQNRNVTLARVRVYRKDWPRPAVGVARWEEYVQTTREGAPTKFWKQMPHNQLAKCAEALALRKAFPAVLAKVYTPEEMAQADNEVPLSPQFQPRPAPKALPAAEPDERVFLALCDRVDSAESAPALNAVAKDANKAHKTGQISVANFEALKSAVTLKRSILGAPKPPQSEPKPIDDGPAYDDANEAEAEAMAAQFDQ
jgi:phage recombination protein Bet